MARRRRPNRPATERREQYARAQARVTQTLVKSFMALNHRGCRRSKIGDVLLRLLAEDSNGDEEDSRLSASASPPWQWQWPQAEETFATASQPWQWQWHQAEVHWPQPTWPWQPAQPEVATTWHTVQSPLEPALAASSSAASSSAKAAEEAEARAASAAPATAAVHRTALHRPASLVLEQLPEAQSDCSFSSTTSVTDHLHSQSLDNTEKAKGETALTPPSGQEDLSVSAKTVLPLQAAQKPLASTLASGLVGESSQAALETEATTAAPTLDERLSAAAAAADLTARQAEGSAKLLASYRRLAPPNPLPGYDLLLKGQEENFQALVRRRDNELHALQQLRAESQAGTTEQFNAG